MECGCGSRWLANIQMHRQEKSWRINFLLWLSSLTWLEEIDIENIGNYKYIHNNYVTQKNAFKFVRNKSGCRILWRILNKNTEDRQQYRAQYYLAGEHTAQGTHHLILARGGEQPLLSTSQGGYYIFTHLPKNLHFPAEFSVTISEFWGLILWSLFYLWYWTVITTELGNGPFSCDVSSKG